MNKIILLAAAIMLYSCGDDGFYGKSLPADREESGYKSVMLPKYRLPHEKLKAQKGDQYSDYRLANPEFYAITATPSGTFRHHNQWEDSQVFFIPYMKSLPAAIKNTITDIVKNTIDYIPVMVAVTSQSNADDFVVKLKNAGVSQAVLDEYLSFFIVALDSIWLIDYGPIPLVNGKNEIAFADFKYYHYRIYDDAYPTKLGNYMGVNTFRAPMYWEGGNFQGDGEGTCYTSQGTLWENAGYSWDDIKKILKDYLKCDNLIILKPLAGEGTAHIDMYMKLGAKDVVVVGNYTEAQDSQNKKVMDDNIQILDAVSFNDGKDLKVFVIPMPDNKGSYEKIWRTYANSALANGLNLVPVYSVNKDLEALAMAGWEEALPDFVHVPILSDEIITWGGAVDCITRQVPVGALNKWIADGNCAGGECSGAAGGYSGECVGDEDCYGPAWLCKCNDCDDCGGIVIDECDGVTFEGCCEDDGTLKYCEGGKLYTYNCGSYGECGWDEANSFYNCGFSAEGPKEYPKSCAGQQGEDVVETAEKAEKAEEVIAEKAEEAIVEKAEETAPDEGQQPEYEKDAAENEVAAPDIQQSETVDSTSQEDAVALETSPETGKEETQNEISQNEETTAPDAGAGTGGGGCAMNASFGFNPGSLLLMILAPFVLSFICRRRIISPMSRGKDSRRGKDSAPTINL